MKPNFPFWLSRPIQDCHFYSKQLNSGNTRAELSADPTVLPLTLAFFLHGRGMLDKSPWPIQCKSGTQGASSALVNGLFCCSPTKVQSISEATMPHFRPWWAESGCTLCNHFSKFVDLAQNRKFPSEFQIWNSNAPFGDLNQSCAAISVQDAIDRKKQGQNCRVSRQFCPWQ